ncbi:MAG: hypothetical protein COA57_09185 [Flavobacteriales bacterium]|nr:Hpt domain-containing protein [Bacteroidales bacterium AH-315-I05]PCJ84461.1 MAG: hypothetical protein COA57_09185 [Flavobacteriales bacterium]
MKTQSQRNYDLSFVREITGGNVLYQSQLINAFVTETNWSMKHLTGGLKQGKYNRIARHAHRMKSTFDLMGIDCLKKDIRLLEDYSKQQKNVDRIPALITRMNGELKTICKSLQNEITINQSQ